MSRGKSRASRGVMAQELFLEKTSPSIKYFELLLEFCWKHHMPPLLYLFSLVSGIYRMKHPATLGLLFRSRTRFGLQLLWIAVQLMDPWDEQGKQVQPIGTTPLILLDLKALLLIN